MSIRDAAAAALLATALVASLGACDASPATSAASAPSPGAPTPAAPASPETTPASADATQPPSGVPSPDSVVRDDSLLEILPAQLDGFPVTVEEASFGEAAADPAFARHVERAAFAVVVGPDDLASGVVAQLRPGVFGDGFFRDWRDSYNQGACAQAGGVAANAEAVLGGRTVHIATCEGGLRVYHAWVEERNAIVSLLSLGDARFGERLMTGIEP